MKKFLIGSLVLAGLMVVVSTDAQAEVRRERRQPKRLQTQQVSRDDRADDVSILLAEHRDRRPEERPHQGPPPPRGGSDLTRTLERILREKQQEREERELAEALQSLLNKAKPASCGCATPAPACEYVKPTCAPLPCPATCR